jgi:hypothetical protein
MTQARGALDIIDGFQIQPAGEGWLLKAIRLRGNQIVALSKTPFEFGEETDNAITLKFQGRPAGRNWPSELKIAVPSDYSFVVTDPKYGQLVYEAKVGIASGGD